MKSVSLSEVAEINPKWDKGLSLDDPISFVGMADLSDTHGAVVNETQRWVREVRKGYTPFRQDDLLIAKITPCFENGKIGIANISEARGAGSTEFHVVRPGPELDKKYALHYLRRPQFRAAGELRMIGSGGQRRVPPEYVADAKIPLPSVADQQRIADILDKVDALRAKRREAIAHLDSLGQSIFHEMFQANPYMPLGDLGVVQGGLQVTTKRDGHPLRRPYLRVANVFKGWIDTTSIKEMGVTLAEVERVSLQAGDLLFVEGHGNVEQVGRCAVWNEPWSNMLHQNHLIRFRPDTRKLLPDYVSMAVNTLPHGRSLQRRAKTTSGLNTITATDVRELSIPVAPLEEQINFGARMADIEKVKSLAVNELTQLDNLFLSLQDRAFKGEL